MYFFAKKFCKEDESKIACVNVQGEQTLLRRIMQPVVQPPTLPARVLNRAGQAPTAAECDQESTDPVQGVSALAMGRRAGVRDSQLQNKARF